MHLFVRGCCHIGDAAACAVTSSTRGGVGGRVGRRGRHLTGTSVSSDINSPCTWESGIITRRGHAPWNGSAAEIWGSGHTGLSKEMRAIFFKYGLPSCVSVFVWDTAGGKEQETKICMCMGSGRPICEYKKTSVSVWVNNSVSLKRWWCHISTEEKTALYMSWCQTSNVKTKLYGTKIGPSHYNQQICYRFKKINVMLHSEMYIQLAFSFCHAAQLLSSVWNKIMYSSRVHWLLGVSSTMCIFLLCTILTLSLVSTYNIEQ